MLTLRKSAERGHADHGWLKSAHTFSFADYYDPRHMGFRSLRVINEDFIDGGSGFGKHPHRDMEIITYVMEGSLSHEDSMGNRAKILPGEVQHMSAGTGVLHSEFNHEEDGRTHLLQIWILPDRANAQPGYGQKSFEAELATGKLTLVVSGDGREGSIKILQDADLHIARPKAGTHSEFNLRAGRGAWIQVTKGQLEVNGQTVGAGDALSGQDAGKLTLKALADSEYLLFDLA